MSVEEKVIDIEPGNSSFVEAFVRKVYGNPEWSWGSKQIIKSFPNINIVSETKPDNYEDYIKMIKSGDNENSKNYKEKLVILDDLGEKLEEDLRYFATSKEIHLSEIDIRANKYSGLAA